MNKPSTDQIEAIRETVKSRIAGFPEEIDSFKEEYPNWRAAIVLSLLDSGLHRMKSYIDDPLQTEISWTNPFLSFEVPCEFSGSLTEGFAPTLGRISYDEIDGSKTASEVLSTLLVDCCRTELTHPRGRPRVQVR